ncbi:hypothetical protein HY492_01325 [Candidatus Woesearchaeota archaeon]|nr:hypothetical protein [Candidatus Woesearchaeota archaeon]
MKAINVWQPLDSRVLKCVEYEFQFKDCRALLFNGTPDDRNGGNYVFERHYRFSLSGKPMKSIPKSKLWLPVQVDDEFVPIIYHTGLVITQDRYAYGENDRIFRRVYDEMIKRSSFAETFVWMEKRAERQALQTNK